MMDLQNRHYAVELRATIAEQERNKLEEDNVTLHLVHLSATKFQAIIEVETKTLGEAMEMVYEEMSKLHHTVAPIMAIQAHTKERVAMLKEAMIALDKIHEWSVKYLGAPMVVPKKDWITMQNTKVQLHIKIQYKDKLTKDVDMVLASYRHLFSA